MIPTRTRDPYTGVIVKTYPNLTHDEIEEKLDKAWKTFKEYKNMDIDFRVECISKCVSILEENKDKYAEMITLEMGKPIKQARGELDR